MKNYEYKTGVTLLEILVVVAIVALLVSTVISIATRIDNQSKGRLTEDTFALLDAALSQFHEYEYNYNQSSDYANFDFPLDCNGLSDLNLITTLKSALNTTSVSDGITPVGDHDTDYSGSEALYFFLNRVPASRNILNEIDKSLITNIGLNGNEIQIIIGGEVYPLLRIIDPWGITLHYDYYDEDDPNPITREENKRTFPVITSAGPDRIFGTVDDMSSR